jgi:hypothetical protein
MHRASASPGYDANCNGDAIAIVALPSTAAVGLRQAVAIPPCHSPRAVCAPP